MQNKPVIIGKCTQMCPESEITMRESQRLLHPMELLTHSKTKADRTKMVKEFCRSSAGQHMQKPEVLRPFDTLNDTIAYLLFEAINMDEFAFHIRYDYICDRLRAVRQDMIIQDLPKHEAICILQPIVRFYAYASYRMCDEPLQKYDAHLNNKHFQECLKRLLSLYDDCEEFETRFPHRIDCSTLYADSRPQIEAIYVLFNLGSGEALNRALRLNERWKNTAELQAAIKVSLLYRNNNFVAVCRLVQDLPHLMAAIVMLRMPAIRKTCLQVMSWGYSSKNLRFPLEKLQELLLYDNEDDLLEDVKCCGLEYHLPDDIFDVKGGVVFGKDKFNVDVNLGVRKVNFVNEKLKKYKVHELVLFGN
ncbi:germinal-center associated nuclear protein-like [Atheta coriaria]|uniref:germinal-center associated nuclear protein-like n=1 Tax=Dalotia coriaria TaxID=877792 RepID=UPI0031F36C6B